jgi:hypothetical protein
MIETGITDDTQASMKRNLSALASLLLLLTSPLIDAQQPYYGFTLSDALVTSSYPNYRGNQFMLTYDPQRFQWRKFNIYFDAGYSRIWVNSNVYHALNIYSIAPVIRYTFTKRGPFSPYLDLSIGASWLSKTRLANKNYGIHFAFQDRIGVGALFGPTQQVALGIHGVHYSNAHLAKRNSGITIPVVLDLSYRFQ